jgi:ribonuclease P protein component
VITGAEFPREARLLQPEDFLRAMKTRAQRGRFLWVYRRDASTAAASAATGSNALDGDAPTPQRPTGTPPDRPQLGLMIGKKNARTSVLRNAIKRRLREQFRVRQAVLPAQQYVVRLSSAVKLADVPAVIGEWTAALDRDVSKRRSQQPRPPSVVVA